MKVVLVGYMASGKSIISKELGEKLGMEVIDLDDYITKKEKMSIPELFKNKGEIYFRTIENKYLKELLEQKEDFILATGGGTPCYANNMKWIKENATSVYLKASIPTIADRVIKEKETRPLIKEIKDTDLKEFIAKHLFERSEFYNQADFTLSVDNKSVNEIVKEIEAKVYSK